MRKNKLIYLSFLLLFPDLPIFSQEKEEDEESKKSEFSVNAEIRTRSNLLYGYKKIPTNENSVSFVTEQRTRLGVEYKTGILQMKITLQDSRIWGDEEIYTKTGVYGDSASVDLQEAWAALNINDFWNFKIGRQVLHLDEGRLVSNRNWLNQGISYDAALIGFSKNDFDLDIALSYNNSAFELFDGEYNPAIMKSLDYLHLKKRVNKNLNISFSSLFSGFQSGDGSNKIRFKTTIGPYAKYYNKKFLAKGEFYYQLGKTVDNVDVNAYFFNLETGYNFSKLYLGAGIDYLSGQDPDTDIGSRFQSFDILYGARFKYYGNLNYVLTPASTMYGGVVNPFFRFNVKFNKKHNVKTTYHLLSTAQEIANPDIPEGFYDRNLGSELDMIYTFTIKSDINIKAGYHIAFPSETMEILKGIDPGTGNTPQWFWVMFSFKPTIFASK